MRITCIGAINWDRKVRLLAPLTLATSNPVQRLAGTAGGVGFNVACRLARLHPGGVQLLSVWGDDPEGHWLQDTARQAGVALKGACRSGQASGQYTAVLDAQGELAVALADMHILDELPDAFWVATQAAWPESDAVVIDMNWALPDLTRLSQDAHQAGLPVALVAVSEPKMAHLPGSLAGIAVLLLNRRELLAAAGLPPDASVAQAWPLMQARGLAAMIVTDGPEGVWVCESAYGVRHQPVHERVQPVDVTGAGDTLSATTLHARWVGQCSWWDAVALGQQAASAVLHHTDNR